MSDDEGGTPFARLAADWVTLWQSEIAGLAADPESAAASAAWSRAVAEWARAMVPATGAAPGAPAVASWGLPPGAAWPGMPFGATAPSAPHGATPGAPFGVTLPWPPQGLPPWPVFVPAPPPVPAAPVPAAPVADEPGRTPDPTARAATAADAPRLRGGAGLGGDGGAADLSSGLPPDFPRGILGRIERLERELAGLRAAVGSGPGGGEPDPGRHPAGKRPRRA